MRRVTLWIIGWNATSYFVNNWGSGIDLHWKVKTTGWQFMRSLQLPEREFNVSWCLFQKKKSFLCISSNPILKMLLPAASPSILQRIYACNYTHLSCVFEKKIYRVRIFSFCNLVVSLNVQVIPVSKFTRPHHFRFSVSTSRVAS